MIFNTSIITAPSYIDKLTKEHRVFIFLTAEHTDQLLQWKIPGPFDKPVNLQMQIPLPSPLMVAGSW
ncbi:MAG: hypothetical protein A3G93_05230 [Nitrospinae bacterium RIFCSPLOWO2_12_FULL_45_22]|nr:MAG: hypothetical protein A3G93_05230 [Nitrospinae bacterium RIFCSPLOWO2_12_FULL_45_22]